MRRPKKLGRTCRVASILLLLASVVVACWLPSEASEPRVRTRTVRVMSYNIHVGIGMDKKLNLARISEVILREKPDLVGLQEVDRGVERTQRIDEIVELARLTRMDYAFAHNLDYQGGQYGVAVLSRFPILAIDHRRLANLREAERRGFIRVEVSVGGRKLNFVTTHLDYRDNDNRLFETRQIIKALDETPAPLIVTGDFNDEPNGDSYKLMLQHYTDAWTQAGTGDGLTYPADKSVKRIDYIFFRGEKIRARRAWITQTLASDHLPLVAELEIVDR